MMERPQHAAERGRGGLRIRLEVTVHPGERGLALDGVADLDLDRVPDPEGGVRVLATPEEAIELAERGYEIHILRAVPVAPLDQALVMDDESARAWLEQQVRGIQREQGE